MEALNPVVTMSLLIARAQPVRLLRPCDGLADQSTLAARDEASVTDRGIQVTHDEDVAAAVGWTRGALAFHSAAHWRNVSSRRPAASSSLSGARLI